MGMTFQPKSEKEVSEARLAPQGDYDFQVLEASDEISKKGVPMIKLKISVFNGDALRWHIYDYLHPAMEAKLRHFCDTTGLLSVYESGSLSASPCKGRQGRCRLVIEEGEGSYPDKNSVKDYICRKALPIASPAAVPKPAEPDDDVPF